VQDDGFLSVGRIVGVHGLCGNLKVHSYAESLSVFKPNSRIFVETKDSQGHWFAIEEAKPFRRGVLLSLKGLSTRDLAQPLVGGELFIERANLPILADGEYYWFDIIGLSVFTAENEYIGQVETVIPTQGNDIFVVRNGKRETLIPALASVVQEVNLHNKTMRINLPEGL
jgi:16S rRNA processing protein RimM